MDIAYRANRKPFGKNLIAPAGQHPVARLDFFVGHDLVEHQFSGALPFNTPLQSRLFENRPYAAVLIIDQQEPGTCSIDTLLTTFPTTPLAEITAISA